jgi:hypothetical protein
VAEVVSGTLGDEERWVGLRLVTVAMPGVALAE